MSLSRIFRGHYDHRVEKGRRTLVWIALEPHEAEALDAQLGQGAHRSQSIPIAFVVGGPAETLLTLQPSLQGGFGDAPDMPALTEPQGSAEPRLDPTNGERVLATLPRLDAPTVLDEIRDLLRILVDDTGACRLSGAATERCLGEALDLFRAARGRT